MINNREPKKFHPCSNKNCGSKRLLKFRQSDFPTFYTINRCYWYNTQKKRYECYCRFCGKILRELIPKSKTLICKKCFRPIRSNNLYGFCFRHNYLKYKKNGKRNRKHKHK